MPGTRAASATAVPGRGDDSRWSQGLHHVHRRRHAIPGRGEQNMLRTNGEIGAAR